ncbi:unnamed protein product [Phyllotreta striolata]|uniref:Major facilitator superfamily (MFS) profile domain-containing protein n=1 Tax=Phyllotreta striolata TaxID=444603 RepID=A0A9N9XMY1_PHYSR|nr:unnamed protein product [Phyllotreta striolata]
MTYMNSMKIFQGTLPQLFAVLAATLNAISDGMQYGWTAPVLPILMGPNSPVPITESQGEWMETFLWIGSLMCLPLTMYLVDKIGRKRSILLASSFMFTVWVVTALAPSVEYLYAARLLAGAASDTAYVSTPMYIAEIAEHKIRGFLSSLIFLMMLIGILLVYLVAPFVPIYAHCILGACLAGLELIIFPFMPESPYYLLSKDDEVGAKNALKRLRGPGSDIDKEIAEMKSAVTRQKTERGRLIDLFVVPSHFRALLIMIVLDVAQHFSSISVLLMNLHIILDEAGSIYMEPSTAGIIFAFILLLAATVASFSIDKFGRKILLIISSVLSGFCVLIIAVYFQLKNSGYDTATVSWLPIVSVMLYACAFKLGLGLVPIVLTAELFPTKMKAYGMTIADALYVISSLLSLQVYQRLSDNYGMEYPFYVFAVSCFFTAVFCYYFVPETKGKTLDEIQMILKGMTEKPIKVEPIPETISTHL